MNQQTDNQTNFTFQSIVTKMTGDMKFIGIITIIYGAISCLSIIGAIVGIPIIICGIRLREAADAFAAYRDTKDFDSLQEGFERQSRFFFIQKVLIIISLVFIGLYLIILLFVLGSSMSRM